MSSLPPPVSEAEQPIGGNETAATTNAQVRDGRPAAGGPEATGPAKLKRSGAAQRRATISQGEDLRLPTRGMTAPEFRDSDTSRLRRGMSGHWEDLPTLRELQTRRFTSGLFHLNARDDLRDIGHHISVKPEDKPSQDQPDPNIVVFDGPDDPLNAQNWSLLTKSLQTLLLGISTLVVTFASSVFSSGTQALQAEFAIGQVVATLSTSLFVLGYVVGPLIWGPASEFLGRRNPLLFSYFCFATFEIPVAVAQNVQTIMVCRFFSGMFASGPLAIVAGAFSDFWSAEARGGALAVFALATFAGPAIGPIIGSFVVQSYLGFRWTAWLQVIWGYFMFALMVLFLRESFAPVLLQKKAKKLRFKTKNWALRSKLDEREFDAKQLVFVYLLRPIKMLVVEPILLLLTIYTAFIYGILYLLFGAVPIQFEQLRGWEPGDASLVFIAVFLGAAIGSLIVYLFTPRYVKKLHASGQISVPEERCIPMAIGAVVFPIGLFVFGWTNVQYVESYWPSLVGLLLTAMGVLLIFLQAINYIVCIFMSAFCVNGVLRTPRDAYLFLAANTFLRSGFGAGFPLFTVQMFDRLGYQWACTLLGCLALVMMPIPFLFYRFGPYLRSKSKFAPQIPPAGAQQVGAAQTKPKPESEKSDHNGHADHTARNGDVKEKETV